jgi:hypothetical protein
VAIRRDFQVTEVSIFDPRNYEDILGTQVIDGAKMSGLSSETRLQRIKDHLQDWAGFARDYVSQGECWKWVGDY